MPATRIKLGFRNIRTGSWAGTYKPTITVFENGRRLYQRAVEIHCRDRHDALILAKREADYLAALNPSVAVTIA